MKQFATALFTNNSRIMGMHR